MKAIEAGADQQQQQPRSPGVAKPPPNNATSYTPPSAEINFNNNNNASAIANIHGHANSEIYNGDTPSPVTVGGYASSELLDEESASLRPIIGYQRRRSGSGGARFFKPRGSPRPQGHGQQGRKYGTPPERTPSNRAMTRPEQLIRQECRLKRQNSDPSPGTKRKPKLEIFPPPSPSPNHNSSTELYTQPSSPIYPKNVDEDLLKVPFRCGASPSVGSFQSDPESCLDGLQFQYSTTYGEEDDDYEEPFSIGGRI